MVRDYLSVNVTNSGGKPPVSNGTQTWNGEGG